jgi:hypothetical protein
MLQQFYALDVVITVAMPPMDLKTSKIILEDAQYVTWHTNTNEFISKLMVVSQ